MKTSNNGDPSINTNVLKAAKIIMVGYQETNTARAQYVTTWPGQWWNETLTESYTNQPYAGTNGQWLKPFQARADYHYAGNNSEGGPYSYDDIYNWTNWTLADATLLEISGGATNNYYDPLTGYVGLSIPPIPDQDQYWGCASCGEGYEAASVIHYYADVKYHYDLGGGYTEDLAVNAKTQMKLYTGGKAGVNRKSLFTIHVDATEYGKPPLEYDAYSYPWWDTPLTTVNPMEIEVLGWWVFGHNLDSSGNLYCVLPDNAALDLNLRIPGVKHYNATPTVTKHRLVHETMYPALTDTNRARTTLGVGEEVKFGFTPQFSWTVDWSVSGGGQSSYPFWYDAAGEAVYNGTGFTAPSNAANVTVTASFFGVNQSLKVPFTVLEPSGVDPVHTCIVETNFPAAIFYPGQAGAAMHLNVFMQPAYVSFYRVMMEEVGEDATNVTGYFTNIYTPPSHIGHGADDPFTLNWDNSWPTGPTGFDYCYSPTQPYNYPQPWSQGSYTWNIPWNWCIDSSNIHSNSIGWQQIFTLDSSGTVKITKFTTEWVQRTTNGVINNSPRLMNTTRLNTILLLCFTCQLLVASQPAGIIIGWGYNDVGQATGVRNGLYTNGIVTINGEALSNVVAISASGHCLALKRDGKVIAWGANYSGQTIIPIGLENVIAVSAGPTFSLALKNDGTVTSWGSSEVTNIPAGLSNVIEVSAGYGRALALKGDGTAVEWGEAKAPKDLTNIVAIACGKGLYADSLALRGDGTVVSWGVYPSHSATLTNIVAVAAGGTCSLALKHDGTIQEWSNTREPHPVAGLSNVVAITVAGDDKCMALMNDGTVMCWGGSLIHQLGVPDGLTNIVAIAAGGYFCLAITTNRAVAEKFRH